MDEYVSVNLFGDRVKKSLGTAFKFYDKKSRATTVSVYLSIALISTVSPSFKEFSDLFADIELLKSMGDIIFPKGVWFEGFIKLK